MMNCDYCKEDKEGCRFVELTSVLACPDCMAEALEDFKRHCEEMNNE